MNVQELVLHKTLNVEGIVRGDRGVWRDGGRGLQSALNKCLRKDLAIMVVKQENGMTIYIDYYGNITITNKLVYKCIPFAL